MSGFKILVGLMLAATALNGCKASTGGGDQAHVKTELADNLSQYHVDRIAVLDISNVSGDPDATEMSRYVLQALNETGYYQIVTASRFAQDAERTGVAEEHGRMVSTWQKTHKADARVVQKVLEATGHDAVLGVVVSKWEEVKIDATQEGTSDTSVGLELKLFGVDGTQLWGGNDTETEHSIAYFPEYNQKSTVGGRKVTTSAKAVPDPPPIEKVAMETARNVVSTMPNIKSGEATP